MVLISVSEQIRSIFVLIFMNVYLIISTCSRIPSAGTIAALGNGRGVRGVIDDGSIRLHIVKGLDNEGDGTMSNVMEMVEACIIAGSDVINMSFVPSGSGGYLETFDELCTQAYTRYNTLLVAAAGNEGNRGLAYPASYRSVMSVAAVDQNGRRPSFSQYNSMVEISGPGVTIVSTEVGNTYDDSSGTSQATPHVAGVAALLWSYDKSCTAQQVRRILLASARPLASNGRCDEQYGRGLVQAADAIEMLKSGGCSVADNVGIFSTSNGFNTGKANDLTRMLT